MSSFPIRLAALIAILAGPAAAGDGIRAEPNYQSYPGAGAQIEPFFRSTCPPDLSNYGGCPVRVYSGPYGNFWSAPPPLQELEPPRPRRPVHKG